MEYKIKKAINLLDDAWSRVGEEPLARCWNNILHFAENDDDPEYGMPFAV